MFTHLHRHSEFSVLDGMGTAEDYAKRAAEMGQHSLALTDHGTLGGALHHIQACIDHEIFPIVGVEAYYKPNRSPHDQTNRDYYHMVLLAKNMKGWKNLLALTSASYRDDSFYYKPIIDDELLRMHSEGIIASTACMAGFLAKSIFAGDSSGADAYIKKMQDIFREDLYFEIMPNTVPDQKHLNAEILGLGWQHGVPVVATTDAHYACADWAPTHKILVEHIYEHEDGTLFLMDENEIADTFAKNHPNLPREAVMQAISNSNEIAGRCNIYGISKQPKYPRTKSPDLARKKLRDWCDEGLRQFMMNGRIPADRAEQYRQQIEYELDVFENNGVLDYFVIVGDLVRWAKDNNVQVGVGRGSAAGCLVSYLIGITGIDPITHGLLFERFLNPERKGMPDIDVDFDSEGRERVKQYLRDKWGEDHVADIITYQTYGARSAIKKVSASMKLSFEMTNRLTETIGDDGMSLVDLRAVNEHLDRWANDHPEAWGHALRIEGQTSAESKHAAGVVITDRPIEEYMPTMRARDGSTTTAWSDRADFPIISAYGFLKIDLLGLAALSRWSMCCDLIKQNHGVEVDFNKNPDPVCWDPDAGDPEILSMFQSDTIGVFQAETFGISGVLRQMKCDHFSDIAAAISLFRPGPIENIPSYCARKLGKEPVTYLHPDLEPILKETYGLYVYQEQAMQIAQVMAGWSLGEADTLRKAIGKKDAKLMSSLKGKFIEGCVAQGHDKSLAQTLWRENELSQRYAFNKSHAVSYAAAAYTDMWLKYHYPAEFYTALISTIPKAKRVEKVPKVLRAVQASGIPLLPPDINLSAADFSTDGEVIRFGLLSIKGMGDGAANEIIEKRPFSSMEDVEERVAPRKCNSGNRKSLLECGAYDTFSARADWSVDDCTRLEIEKLGFSLSKDVSTLIDVVRRMSHNPLEIEDMEPEEECVIGGEVVEVKQINTKRGELMAFVSLAIGQDTYRATFFPPAFSRYASLTQLGSWVMINGKKDDRGGIKATVACLVDELVEHVQEKKMEEVGAS